MGKFMPGSGRSGGSFKPMGGKKIGTFKPTGGSHPSGEKVTNSKTSANNNKVKSVKFDKVPKAY